MANTSKDSPAKRKQNITTVENTNFNCVFFVLFAIIIEVSLSSAPHPTHLVMQQCVANLLRFFQSIKYIKQQKVCYFNDKLLPVSWIHSGYYH